MTKSEETKLIVGLEVGTSKVVAVAGEVLPDGVIKVWGSGVAPSKGIDRGSIVDLDCAVNAIQRAIDEAESIADCDIVGVTLAITGPHITNVNESGAVPILNEVKQENIDAAIHNASSIKLPDGLELLHVIPQEYRVDRQTPTKNPMGLLGVRLNAQVHLIACHQDWLRNLHNAVERSKLKIDQVVFSGIASGHAVLTEDEKELGVCLIDIGGGTMDILVYTGGALRFSKVIPFGGNNITDYIAQMFTTSRHEAEGLKLRYGSAISPPSQNPDKKFEVIGLAGRMPRTFNKAQLAQVVERCYTDLFSLVQHELNQVLQELYKKELNHDLIAGIVLTGGGSQVEDIVECAKNVFTGLPVRVGRPLNISGLTDYVDKPQYATVLGLLQYTHLNAEPNRALFSGSDESVGKVVNVIKKTIDLIKSKF